MMITPDIFVTLIFYTKDKGGRSLPTPQKFFSCIFYINGENHDARLFLETIGSIYPGDSKKNVPVKFLCSDLVLPKINVGSKFFIKDGGIVAEGVVEKIPGINFVNGQ